MCVVCVGVVSQRDAVYTYKNYGHVHGLVTHMHVLLLANNFS